MKVQSITILVFLKFIFWAINPFSGIAQTPYSITSNKSSMIFKGDSTFKNLPKKVFKIQPVYSNPVQSKTIKPITYTVKQVYTERLGEGFHLCTLDSIEDDTIASFNIYNDIDIIQIINKTHKGFIGYLEELLNVPFVLPPKKLLGEAHQTDLRLGVDCAELAIYGKRRQGYKIPYCGPRGIKKYLKPTSKLTKGTIIHFGFQVSVLYEDKGQIGHLDNNDLLIHAYKDKAEIKKLGNTDLKKRSYQLYQWKE
ncbi:MAG: hypothetical protein ABEH43_03115 [Flavobacteriales bacterium]